MLRMTRFGLGCVEGPPSQHKRLGFAISWPGFSGVSRSMSFWPWNWKYKAGLFLKFPGLFLKFPGLFLKFPGLILKFPGLNSKVSRNKGWPQHRKEKGLKLELWVGLICLSLARGVGAPRCLVSSFEIGPATSHSCFPVVAVSGLINNNCRWCNFWSPISAFYSSCCDVAREILANSKLCICSFVSVLLSVLWRCWNLTDMNYANICFSIYLQDKVLREVCRNRSKPYRAVSYTQFWNSSEPL